MKFVFQLVFLPLVSITIFEGATAEASVPVVPTGAEFICTPSHVWDGDGPIWCREGPRIRLSGINTREMDGSCNSNSPCTNVDPNVARDALVGLLGTPTGIGQHGHVLIEGPALRCLSDGSAGGNRTAAWCVSPLHGDINCAMVEGGWAARWDRYWNGHVCRN
jgi:endonuclease YncB( thermonuclease family)